MTTKRVLPIVVGAALFVLWHVAALTRSPLPYFDDTFFASIGDAFTRTGEMRLAVAPLWLRDPVYLYGPVYFLAQRFVFEHFGFGLFQSRILALAGGLASIVLAFAVLRAAGVRIAVAVAAGLLLALDPTLNVSLHGGRMDGVALAFVLASLLMLVRGWAPGREPGLAASVASGVCAALAVLTTPRAGFLVAAVAAVLLGYWGLARTRERARQLVAWGLPIAVLYAVWIAYAFGGVDAFVAYYRELGGQYVGGRFFVRPIHIPLLAALVLAVGLGIARRRAARFAGLTAFAVIGIVAFYALGIAPPRFGTAYSVFMTPLVYLALGGLAPDRNDPHDGRLTSVAFFGALLVFNASVFAARAIVEVSQWDSRDPAPVVALVRSLVPPGAKVIGDDKFYFAVKQAGADFEYWERGGSLDERVAHHTDQYGFDYLVTGLDRSSELFQAYGRRVPLVEVGSVARPEEPAAVARWLTATARAFHLGAPLVADYGGTVFIRADRDPRRR